MARGMRQQPAFDVLICGSLHLDIVVTSPHLPGLDETVTGSGWAQVCGGKGGNQAVMAARLGCKTAMIGAVGDDDFGKQLIANLHAANVDCRAVITDTASETGMSVAILNASGEYGAVIVSGCNLALDPDRCAQHFDALGGAQVLVLQNEIPEAVNIAVAGAARHSGTRVIFNAAPARLMSATLLNLIDVLVVNRVEAEMLSGLPVFDAASAIAALPALRIGQMDIIITLGSAGLIFKAYGDAPVIVLPHPVTVVSTHGAGDCFIGALATALARSDTLADACVFANQCAARYVTLPLEDRHLIAKTLEDGHAPAY